MTRKNCNICFLLVPHLYLLLALLSFSHVSPIDFATSKANSILLFLPSTCKAKHPFILKGSSRYFLSLTSVQDNGQSQIRRRRCTVLKKVKQPLSVAKNGLSSFTTVLYVTNRDDESVAPEGTEVVLEVERKRLNEDCSTRSSNNNTNHCVYLYEKLHRELVKAISSNQRKHQSLSKELEKAQQAENLQHRADLLIANLYLFKTKGVQSITVQDWDNKEIILSINTSAYNTAQEEAQDLYEKAKKMKRGSIIVSQLLQESMHKNSDLEILLKELQGLQKNVTLSEEAAGAHEQKEIISRLNQVEERIEVFSKKYDLIRPRLQNTSNNKQLLGDRTPWNGRSSNKTKLAQQHACRNFRSPCGLTVLVGRNKRGNEYLSFHAARGNDVWFHTRGCPGAHVLLQVRRGDPRPADEDLQFAANLAAYYSDARTERKVTVTMVEPKHIQKPRGAPLGAVKIRQELGSVIGYPMIVAEEVIRENGETGKIGEKFERGALRDKAKNRKRTIQIEKEKQAKKRAHHRESQLPRARRMQHESTALTDSKDFM